jgi:hypothetical protein
MDKDMTDKEFLRWVAWQFINVHEVPKKTDFIQRLLKMGEEEESRKCDMCGTYRDDLQIFSDSVHNLSLKTCPDCIEYADYIALINNLEEQLK